MHKKERVILAGKERMTVSGKSVPKPDPFEYMEYKDERVGHEDADTDDLRKQHNRRTNHVSSKSHIGG